MLISKRTLLSVFAAIAIFGCAINANADTVSYTDSVDLTATNWSTLINVPKFDSSRGTLNSIKFDLYGFVEGLAKFESQDNTPTTVTMDLSGKLTLTRPDNSIIVVTIPVAQTSDNVTVYDQSLDYGGTSGKTYNNLSADRTETITTINSDDFTLFTGTGNISLPIFAQGNSSGSGSGNLILNFATSASGQATVTYDYTPTPEPTTVLLLGLGSLILRRRIA